MVKKEKIGLICLSALCVVPAGAVAVLLFLFVFPKEEEEHQHVYESVVLKEATCTEEGELFSYCECGDEFYETIPRLAHDYVEEAVQANCQHGGYTVYTCSRCGESYRTEETEIGEHTFIETTVAPTCTEDGYTRSVCSACGEEEYVSLPATGHEYKQEEVAATCEEAGYTRYTCSACGHSYTTDYVAPLGHDYILTFAREATNTADGCEVYTCTRCGASYEKTLSVHEHAYTRTVTQEPTCTAAGTALYVCSVCGDRYTEAIPAGGHSYQASVTKAATCTEGGTVTYLCAACGDSYTETTAALGHSYGAWILVSSPTETLTGLLRRTCGRDAAHKEEFILPVLNAIDYTYTIESEPTLYADGTAAYRITVGGTTYTFYTEIALSSAEDMQFLWNDGDNTYTLYRYFGSAESVVIPATYNGFSVRDVSPFAFYGNGTVKEILIRAQVICARAFEDCSALTTVVFGEEVQTIEAYAFYGCAALQAADLAGTWKATSGTSSVTISSADEAAAQYLTATYVTYVWGRQ